MKREASTRSPQSIGIRLGIAVFVAVVIWFLPAPEGVTPEAWHLFAIFVATIVAAWPGALLRVSEQESLRQ